MTDAMSRQIGGDHYSKWRIQPFEFTMANGWDACAHTVLKYVHRHTDKGGAQDLDKAIHTSEIRFAQLKRLDHEPDLLLNGFRFRPAAVYDPRITILDYISYNRIPTPEALTLTALEMWVREPVTSPAFIYVYRGLISRIEDLKRERYGEPA